MYVVAIMAMMLVCIDVLLAFTVAPLVKGASLPSPVTLGEVTLTHKLLLSQKIFYLHVPVAISSFVMLMVMAWHGIRYLMTNNKVFDLKSYAAARVALVMVLATMASGVLWTRFEWGVWWVWEPRLTTYALLTLMIFAYMVLRSSIVEAPKRAAYCAVFGIIASVNAPLSFVITRLIPSSIHPVVLRSDAGLPLSMLVPFVLGLLGMLCLSYALYRMYSALHLSSARVDRLIDELEASYHLDV